MKKIALLLTTALIPAFMQAQVDLAYPVGDARGGAVMGIATGWEAIGINPSNLGWAENHAVTISLFNLGVNAQSTGLSMKTINNLMRNRNDSSSGSVYVQNILGAEKGMNLFADVNWLAGSFRVNPLGGTFAVNIRDRLVSNTQAGPQAEQVFNNNNDLTDAQVLNLLNGSNFTVYHYREYNLSFGRELFVWNKDSKLTYTPNTVQSKDNKNDSGTVKIFGGLGVRYITGLAYANAQIMNQSLYGNYCISSSYTAAPFPRAPGHGFGTDIGLSAFYLKWKFGISVTDIGFIKWKQNYATVGDTSLSQLGNDFNSFINNTQPNFAKGNDFTIALPAKLRMGANYTINKHFSASADAAIPLNNVVANLPGPYIALAGQVNLNSILVFDLGFAEAQEYGLAMPVSMQLGFGKRVHMALGTNDLLTLLGGVHNPSMSFAFGLVRVDIK